MTEGPAVTLRPVEESDLEAFFEHQLDPEATAMAAFPARDREAFFAHWHKIMADPPGPIRTITLGTAVAGNIVSWEQDGHQEVGYWIGKPYWGRGVASAALRQFIQLVPKRPLFAWVARHNAGSIRVLEKAGFVQTGSEGDHLILKLP